MSKQKVLSRNHKTKAKAMYIILCDNTKLNEDQIIKKIADTLDVSVKLVGSYIVKLDLDL